MGSVVMGSLGILLRVCAMLGLHADYTTTGDVAVAGTVWIVGGMLSDRIGRHTCR